MHTVLVLGGYGFFGSRICAALARDPSIRLLIGGRDLAKGAALAQSLGLPAEHATRIDAGAVGLDRCVAQLNVDTLINTAGPFQGQDYHVAQAAIQAGCNYIDLADARQFVGGIDCLDQAARLRGVTVVSGASSVPGLSSAVVDKYLPRFARLDSIQLGIGSGARSPGVATVKGIFGYCGKPLQRWERGEWVTTHGWLDLRRHHFPSPVGPRWLSSCDIPDLDLFAKRYAPIRSVTFHAGFASDLGHLVVWGLAGLVRFGLLKSAVPFAIPLNRISQWMEPILSDQGAMFVTLDGIGPDRQPLHLTWNLLAAQNHGPHIPCGASIALTQKISNGQSLPVGAMPCMGLLTVEEYLAPLRDLDIREVIT